MYGAAHLAGARLGVAVEVLEHRREVDHNVIDPEGHLVDEGVALRAVPAELLQHTIVADAFEYQADRTSLGSFERVSRSGSKLVWNKAADSDGGSLLLLTQRLLPEPPSGTENESAHDEKRPGQQIGRKTVIGDE